MTRVARILIWVVVALFGAGALAKIALDRGESLNELDLKFLEQVIADAGAMRPLIKDDPKVAGIAGRMMQLYTEISSKALENEKANQSK